MESYYEPSIRRATEHRTSLTNIRTTPEATLLAAPLPHIFNFPDAAFSSNIGKMAS
jgi:hypothetical protein